MLTILVVALIAAAGQDAAPPAPPAAAPAPARTAEQMESPAGYTYNPEGRRDPFVSLVGRGNDSKQGGDRAAGIPGLLVSEVTVKGVIRGRSGYIAMIQSPDNKTYIVRSGDRLSDGTVKTITQDGVVFSQDVNDPLSLVKHREVPKKVRGSEGRG
jgi:type IV pilus assembly protein PilP